MRDRISALATVAYAALAVFAATSGRYLVGAACALLALGFWAVALRGP